MSKYYWCIHLLDEEDPNGKSMEIPKMMNWLFIARKKALEVIWIALLTFFSNGAAFGAFIDIGWTVVS